MFSLFQRYKEPLIVGALLLVPLISYLSSGHRGRDPNLVDRVVLAISSPVQGVLTWAIHGLGEGVAGYVALHGAHQEATACRNELAEAHAELNSLKEARAENARLKAMLGYSDGTSEPEILARVVGIDPTPHVQSVRLNRGEADGVRVGMPVVTREGVVGQVMRSVGGSSDVMLVTDPASRIGAMSQRTRVRATVTGSGDGKQLSLDFVRRDDDVKEGDQVVTAGTDGVFPRGLLVGTVKDVQRPLVGMFLGGHVDPVVDIHKVEEVFVVPLIPDVVAPAAREGR